jgi:hypothetical protein
LPTSSFDTFFACTIIVAVALIGTAFLGSTMQTRIVSTQDINKDSYLKSIADHIITNTGSPVDWGTRSTLPIDFGIASSLSHSTYELDIDKICRLNSLNNYSLSYLDISEAARLNLALGIEVSQLMTVNIVQSSNSTVGNFTSFTLQISANINSKPISASLHCYFSADTQITEVNTFIPESGVIQVTAQIPTLETENALLIAFARASIDDRITSYAIYNFAYSLQESTPRSSYLALSPLNYTLSLNDNFLRVRNGFFFSYSFQQPFPSLESSQVTIPKLLDNSPLVIVVKGINGTKDFQEWSAYPQIPLKIGANFDGSEQNIFGYIVTVQGVLYKLDLSLGDLPQ